MIRCYESFSLILGLSGQLTRRYATIAVAGDFGRQRGQAPPWQVGRIISSAPGHRRLANGESEILAYDIAKTALAAAEEPLLRSHQGTAAEAAALSLIVVGTYVQIETAMQDEDGIVPNTEEGHIVAIS